MRSEYAFSQVREQLHTMAVGILTDTVNMLGKEYKGKLYVTSHGEGDISKLETYLYEFHFFAKHIRVVFKMLGLKILKTEVLFDIEHKIYSDSPHSTKISFYAIDSEAEEERKKQILQFLAEVMEGIEPIRRFSLRNFKPSQTRKIAIKA